MTRFDEPLEEFIEKMENEREKTKKDDEAAAKDVRQNPMEALSQTKKSAVEEEESKQPKQSAQKSAQKNCEPYYAFFMEVSLKDDVLHFTYDKAKKYEINKHLGRIPKTAAAVYTKTTSRAKEHLHKNVNKFHVFESQLK